MPNRKSINRRDHHQVKRTLRSTITKTYRNYKGYATIEYTSAT